MPLLGRVHDNRVDQLAECLGPLIGGVDSPGGQLFGEIVDRGEVAGQGGRVQCHDGIGRLGGELGLELLLLGAQLGDVGPIASAGTRPLIMELTARSISRVTSPRRLSGLRAAAGLGRCQAFALGSSRYSSMSRGARKFCARLASTRASIGVIA
jgi:hypothetical protein